MGSPHRAAGPPGRAPKAPESGAAGRHAAGSQREGGLPANQGRPKSDGRFRCPAFRHGSWRFTQKDKSTFYAYMMKWRGGKVVIKSFNIVNLGKIKKVELLGYDKHIKFVQTDEALEIVLPSENPNINISVVKVEI